MHDDPHAEPSIEPSDDVVAALEPTEDASDDLGDAGRSKGEDFMDPNTL